MSDESKKIIGMTTYQAGMLQSRAYRALSNFMTDFLQLHDLSLPQWSLLGLLHEAKEYRPSQLAEMLGVKPPVATKLINEMEAKKLLARISHGKDGRGAVISITSEGAKLVGNVESHLRQEMRDYLGDIGRDELVTYLKVLARLAAKLK